ANAVASRSPAHCCDERDFRYSGFAPHAASGEARGRPAHRDWAPSQGSSLRDVCGAADRDLGTKRILLFRRVPIEIPDGHALKPLLLIQQGAAYRLTWRLVPPPGAPLPGSPLETILTQSESLPL